MVIKNDKTALSQFEHLKGLDLENIFGNLKTPCYVLDKKALKYNGEILCELAKKTGCKILLAQKAFSNYGLYDFISPYLAGTEASGLYEAKLGREYMPAGEVHTFSGAYREDEIDEIIKVSDHVVFNSIGQLKKYGKLVKDAGKSVGIRINPEHSTQEGHAIYDPCAPGSRFGVTKRQWDSLMDDETFSLIDGIHFHTLCEQDSDDLNSTLDAVIDKFGDVCKRMSWINFGGGHHITKKGYDLELLEHCISKVTDMWNLTVYLEPGEAVALNAGYLLSEVLDITTNGNVHNCIIDASAACHMPDILEMPYRPEILGAYEYGDSLHDYRIGAATCLAGDVIGNYSFDEELKPGDRLLFGDMAIYTTCKNNTFNGMRLPDINILCEDNTVKPYRRFSYEDFKSRI